MGMVEQSIWMRKVTADPGHSSWYIERFRAMARAGEDLAGEARLVDAMVPAGPAGWVVRWPRPVTKSSVWTSTRS